MMLFEKTSLFKVHYFYIICLALVLAMIYIMLGKTGEMFNDSIKVTVIDGAKHMTFQLEHCNCKR